jgi:addiction module RelE/StbE family toxin
MIVKLHRNFEKQIRLLPLKVQKKTQERLLLFIENPFHPLLENHSLKGFYLDYRSINITGDWRALYKLNGEECIFVHIDTHSNLYR